MIAGDRDLEDLYLCRRISPYDRSTRGYLPVVQVLLEDGRRLYAGPAPEDALILPG